MEQFGNLLRYGTFTVLKSESNKEPEREVCYPFYYLGLTMDLWALSLVFPHIICLAYKLKSTEKGSVLAFQAEKAVPKTSCSLIESIEAFLGALR